MAGALLSISLNPLAFGAAAWERTYLERHDVGMAVVGERELAQAMGRYALQRCNAAEVAS